MWSTKCPVGEMSIRGNVLVGKCPVGEVSFGELYVRGNVCRGTFRRGSDSRGTVRIPLTTAIIYDYCNLVVKIDLFTSIYFLQILIKP